MNKNIYEYISFPSAFLVYNVTDLIPLQATLLKLYAQIKMMVYPIVCYSRKFDRYLFNYGFLKIIVGI